MTGIQREVPLKELGEKHSTSFYKVLPREPMKSVSLDLTRSDIGMCPRILAGRASTLRDAPG